eukprot:gene3669-4186_t
MSCPEASSKKKSSSTKKTKKKKSQLGNIAIDVQKQAEFTEKVKQLSSESAEDKATGVVYVGHIPHGFYEEEMKEFFSQFGTVNKVRLSRSKKTAGSKGYAFIEFAYEDVAKIAAETMDNYLMFDRLLKCKFIPKERIHPRMWQGANRKFSKVDWAKRERDRHNRPKTVAQRNKQVDKLLAKEVRKRKQLSSLGIDYEFPGYAAQSEGQSKPKKVKESND